MSRWPALLLVAAILAWTGCAESQDRTLPGSPSPTTETQESGGSESFVEAANAACDKADERMSRVEAPASPKKWLDFGRRIERGFEDALEDLASLEPPQSLARHYRKWLNKLERSGHAFRLVYRTVALRYPAVDTPEDRVNRAIDRADRADRSARQFAQLELTDLYSCYDVLPFMHARIAATNACGGFLFCR